MSEFEEFPKIARLRRNCVITEKIDGTNAQVFVELDIRSEGAGERKPDGALCVYSEVSKDWYALRAGSRNRWITPEADNFGFARWAYANAQTLVEGLGEGRHYGEWWGSGVQRGYGLTGGEKRFSLFNSGRWNAETPQPACCHVVPVLYSGPFTTDIVDLTIASLKAAGSAASPGFMKPEGVVIYLAAARTYFKQTIEKDEEPKGKNTSA
jgi:hypothetical protein